MADVTQGLPTLAPQPMYVPPATDPNFAMLTKPMMRPPLAGQVAPNAFGNAAPYVAPPVAPAPYISPVRPDTYGPAGVEADRQLRQMLTPNAIAPGLATSGYPTVQPGQGGTLAELANSNGSQFGIAQPQPVNPRMMGTPDPGAGYPNFTSGSGSPAGFGGTPSPSSGTGAPAGFGGAAPLPTLAGTNAASIAPSVAPSIADNSGPVLNPRFAGPGPVTSAMFANPQGPAAGTAGGAAAAPAAAPVYAGGNAVPVNGVGGMVGGFRDPGATISAGFDRQQSTAQDYMSQALNYIQGGGDIFERATRGRAIAGILHAVVGPNNEGQVQGQGADALNQSLAGVSSSAIGANANMYGSDQAIRANEERIAGARQEVQFRSAHTPVQVGASPYSDPLTKMTIPLPTFGLPVTNADGTTGFKALSPNRAIPEAPGVENQIRTRASGAQDKFTNGQWVPQK